MMAPPAQIVRAQPTSPVISATIDGVLKIQELVQNESRRRRESDEYKHLMAEYKF